MKQRSLCLLLLCLTCLLLALVACTENTPPADTRGESSLETEPQTEPVTSTPTETEAVSVPEPELETETEAETFPIYEEAFGSVRVQLYSPSVLRIEEASDNTFCDDNTIAVTNRSSWPGVQVERVASDAEIRLVTAHYTVVIPAEAPSISDVVVLAPSGEEIWDSSGNPRTTVNLPTPAETPEVWSFNDRPRVSVPRTGFTEVTDEPDNGFVYNTSCRDFYVFVCNGDPFTLRADYNRLVGACDMVTVKALGLWFSRYHAYSDSQLLSLVKRYRDKGFPLDYVVVDTDWRVGASTGYEINTQYFPSMKSFLAQMHERNVHIAFNDHVRDCGDSMLSSNQIQWFNQNLTKLHKMGLDTWWYDRNWGYRLNSPFRDIDADMLGQMMYQAISKSHFDPLNRRTVLMSNYYKDYASNLQLPAYVGTHRYSIQWTGDIHTEELQNELENMVKIGTLTSSAYISSDIGGYANDPTSEHFIRWTQYGCLSPIMRYHSVKNDRSPWMYGSTAEQVALTYIQMRYRLLPLFYTLAQENYADGLPMARRLDFYYPQYEESCRNDQYLLGEDILVAPITASDYGNSLPASAFTDPDGKEGIRISFYNNTDLSGDPVAATKLSTLDFDWQIYAPLTGVNADKFSARLETTARIPDGNDVYLSVKSDDGVRVYVDGVCIIDEWKSSDSEEHQNREFVLKAGETYDLRVDYYDDTGLAILKVRAVPTTNTYTRTVFIPDGKWMDVFSGTVYEGPKTVTVSHGITTSPIFVRLGSLTALAQRSEYADTAQWERLVLDVYPSEGASDVSTLYEDDGASLDYQSGGYRETALTLSTVGGKTTVGIGAAKGDYQTEWTEREWTLRVHASDVKSVTVNGEAVEFTVVKKDTAAAPFAAEGGSPDGDVVTVTFKAPINRATEIVVE